MGKRRTKTREFAARCLRTALLAWYAQHKRELPWRRDRDAYRVWVSEIMLQQTRVAAVLEHYRAFLEAFPTVEALARAPEERVLALWSGLGYYRRARMLHQAAKVVVKRAGRRDPADGGGAAQAAGSRALHGCGHCEHRLWRAGGGGGRQCGAGVEPAWTARRAPAASAWQRAQELLDGRRSGSIGMPGIGTRR